MFRHLLPYFVLGLMGFNSMAAFAKYTVCTATINSMEEREVFRAKLNPADFEFVELTDFSTDQGSNRDDWFQNACKKGVKCDVLVVSGHFGGEFFGKSELHLSLNDLNKYSCYNRCDGIMSHPKEVYLFGCNTLATKEKDHRDERTLIDVYVRDGIERVEAERRVGERYGPFGFSFRDQVERSFENVPLIYGFTSVGPAGAHVKASLEKYFDQIGDFKKHLESIDNRSRTNQAWSAMMKSYPIAIGKGLSRSNPLYTIKENSCTFTDDQKPLHERLELALNILSSDPYIYLPTVSHFVNKELGRSRSSILPSSQQDLINDLVTRWSSRNDLAKLVMDNARSKEVTPGIRVDLLNAAKNLRWLPEADFDVEMRRLLEPFVSAPTTGNVDLICSLLSEDDRVERFIRSESLLLYSFDKLADFKMIFCLRREDARLSQLVLDRALRHIDKWKDPGDIHDVLLTVNETVRGSSAKILAFAKTLSKRSRNLMLGRYINKVVVRRSSGVEQIQAVRAALSTKDVSELSDLARALGDAEKIEPESSLLLLEKLFQLPDSDLNRLYTSLPGFLSPDLEVEEWLAGRWGRMSGNLKDKLSEMLSAIPKYRSPGFRAAILRDLYAFYQKPHSQHMTRLFLLEPLAVSELTVEEIAQLKELAYLDQSYNNSYRLRLYRHILYQQAKAGRTEMTEDIRTGTKARHLIKLYRNGWGYTFEEY